MYPPPQELAAYQLLKDKMHKTQAKENNMLMTSNLKDIVAHICLGAHQSYDALCFNLILSY